MCILDFVMGGCVSLNQFERHHQPNIFHVYNVNEFGIPVSPGHIELTDSSLVLHQKSSRESVVWPMRSLRRYGFDAELFSFESGRRCTTGPGVYAFKCRRAEQLFSMLQDKILSSGQDNLSNHSGILHPPPSTLLALQLPAPLHLTNTHNQPPPPPLPAAATQIVIRQENIPDPDYLEPIVINRSNSNTSQSQTHNYVNDIRAVPENETVVNTSPEHLQRHLSSSSDTQAQLAELTVSSKSVARGHSLDETNYAKLDDLLKQEHTANRHLYMNVTASGGAEMVDHTDEEDSEPFSCDHCYANVAPGATSLAGLNNKALRPSKSMFNYPQEVNYAILDLQKRSARNNNIVKMKETTEMSNGGGAGAGGGLLVVANGTCTVEGYAKIDFDKTTALSNSINPTLDDDKSVRKTRHNSNASSLLLLKRTSLAVTE